jgi:hypothetical protein
VVRWLLAGAAVLAAVAIGAVLALTVGGGMQKADSSSTVKSSIPAASFSIMSLTPEQLAHNALGTGYALPSAQSGPTVDQVLASLSPSTRRYTKAIVALTFAQLEAGAAGSP